MEPQSSVPSVALDLRSRHAWRRSSNGDHVRLDSAITIGRITHEPRPNCEHIYFAVGDLEDVYRRARRVGGLSTRTGDGDLPMGGIAQRPWGERSFYINDPSGNPLCFVDERTVFTTGLI